MTLTAGIILNWQGSIANIPGGWLLCDGTQGTPDLRDRFIQGAGGALNPDDTGGATTHDHDFLTDPHNHTLPAGSAIASGAVISNITEDVIVSGTTDPASNNPPFYALAFIMKS